MHARTHAQVRSSRMNTEHGNAHTLDGHHAKDRNMNVDIVVVVVVVDVAVSVVAVSVVAVSVVVNVVVVDVVVVDVVVDGFFGCCDSSI